MDDAVKVLRKDPIFGPLVRKHGLPKLSRGRAPFQSLCRAIIYQQISGKAASSIYSRFVALYGIVVPLPIDWDSRGIESFPTPRQVLETPDSALRTAGLSTQKIRYIRDLAAKFDDGTIPHERLQQMTNDEIITLLSGVHGIGTWTVQMFLIFTLHRLDVLPVDDLGIRRGFMRAYGMKSLPAKRTMERFARPWRAYASVASWYLWRVADDT